MFRHQMLKKRCNAKKILRHTDVYYCVVVGRLDLDLYPLPEVGVWLPLWWDKKGPYTQKSTPGLGR